MVASTHSISFSDNDFAALSNWDKEELNNLCLTIWVNSNDMRIAVCPAPPTADKESNQSVVFPKNSIYIPAYKVTKSSQVQEKFDSISAAFAQHDCTVVFATMSFAGPVSQDHVVVTNWQCEARERVIHFTQLPFDIFPLGRRKFMNDLEAASYGIIAKESIFNEVFSLLIGSPEPDDQKLDGSSLVLSIGSGFGASYICRDNCSDYNCVVSSEAGHCQVIRCEPNDPYYEDEYRFIQFVSQKLHGGSHQPEWEDLCACRGLELAYMYLKTQKNVATNKCASYDEIRQKAIKREDEDAMKAFVMHFRFIMRAAQTLSLGIPCQRVFLISVSQVKNYEIMNNIANDLKLVFEEHPRKEWFKNTRVYTQKALSNFSLSGGLFLSRNLAKLHRRESHFNTS
ncbi:putative glucokinase 2 [Histomonas meleagridis]|uniref:putative glucokinase 2 n=1 Tax=Histomonas meleagridis TaxID=135588 RepID=UPI00355AC5E4|nr:putative glucokinase 2 [Histomonas meleagridis]KAH0803146.1 putative glucokinase 2 [Histomonas meleagridis]